MNLHFKLWIDYYFGTLLLMVLKPLTILLGRLMRRNHLLRNCSTVTYVKMMGGGSLVIAYPSLVAVRNAPNVRRLQLLTTPAIKPFGETLGVFDEIIVIRDSSVPLLILDSLKALVKLFRTDAIVDLEIFSRLTTIFALLSCARNRIGFYTNASFWRKDISTHLLFCNVSNKIFDFYDQVARLFDGQIPQIEECRERFQKHLGIAPAAAHPAPLRVIGIAPGCSDLSRERMLATEQWIQILHTKALAGPCLFRFLGGKDDILTSQTIASGLRPEIQVENLAGKLPLMDSVRALAQLDELICIDSALLHFSRLVGTPVDAYFGPTDPAILLRPIPGLHDTLHYTRISCSPCVHLAARPPCHGNNLCMRYAFNPDAPGERNPRWFAGVQHVDEDKASKPVQLEGRQLQ